MIELLSLVGGGILRLLPEVFSLFKAKKDADHEYRMSKLQLEIDEKRAAHQLDLAHVNLEAVSTQYDYAALETALKAQGTPSGIKWIDGLSSSVRPILTYWWCVVLYTVYKGFIIYSAMLSETSAKAFAGIVFTDFDYSVMSSIIAFWFVDRALRRGK